MSYIGSIYILVPYNISSTYGIFKTLGGSLYSIYKLKQNDELLTCKLPVPNPISIISPEHKKSGHQFTVANLEMLPCHSSESSFLI